MIILPRSSERIFNPSRYIGYLDTEGKRLKKKPTTKNRTSVELAIIELGEKNLTFMKESLNEHFFIRVILFSSDFSTFMTGKRS